MKALFVLLFAGVLLSCNSSKNKDYEVAGIIKAETLQEHPGKKLMETNCYVCHSPSANQDSRIAPPMIAIKKHYINNDTSKEAFIKAMQDWIKNPTEENAKMFGAVRRFGVMPNTPFPENTIEQIADYMFDNTIEQPEWFEEHFKEQKGMKRGKGMRKKQTSSSGQSLSYKEKGLKYALGTKVVLGKNLMGTIQKKRNFGSNQIL